MSDTDKYFCGVVDKEGKVVKGHIQSSGELTVEDASHMFSQFMHQEFGGRYHVAVMTEPEEDKN